MRRVPIVLQNRGRTGCSADAGISDLRAEPFELFRGEKAIHRPLRAYFVAN